MLGEMEIKDEKLLEDRKERAVLLGKYISELERGNASFPSRLYRVNGLGNVYGILVKDSTGHLVFEYPILVSLERNPENLHRPLVRFSLLGIALFWVKINKAQLLYETSGPEVLHGVYLDYLRGFRVSQLGKNPVNERQES